MPRSTNKKSYGLLLATALLGAYPAHAQRIDPVICVNPDNSDPRLLEVEYLSDALVPCRTYYRKWKVREQIGSAENTAGYCEGLVEQVVENLAEDGFLCRSVGQEEDIESLYDRYR